MPAIEMLWPAVAAHPEEMAAAFLAVGGGAVGSTGTLQRIGGGAALGLSA